MRSTSYKTRSGDRLTDLICVNFTLKELGKLTKISENKGVRKVKNVGSKDIYCEAPESMIHCEKLT